MPLNFLFFNCIKFSPCFSLSLLSQEEFRVVGAIEEEIKAYQPDGSDVFFLLALNIKRRYSVFLCSLVFVGWGFFFFKKRKRKGK